MAIVDSQELTSYLVNGVTEVHDSRCADLARSRYRSYDCTGTATWTSKEEFGADLWSDINAEDEYYTLTWEDEIKFFPCVHLRDWEAKGSTP